MQAQIVQRLAGDVRGHQRMTIAIAAHPGAQSKPRKALRCLEPRGVETQMRPRLTQTAIENRQHVREHVVQVVHDVAPLGGHIRLVHEDLAGPPQQRQQRLDIFAYGLLLVGRPDLILTLHQQQVEAPVMLEDNRAFRLGRVRGQHELDAHARQGRRDLVLGKPAICDLLEALPP